MGVVEQLTGRYGPGTVVHGNDPSLRVEAIPTGVWGLDEAIGIDGIPRGRIVEIYGQPGAGKTALAVQLARQVPSALYIDADYGLAPDKGAGLFLAHPDTLEDALDICETAAAGFDMIVIDTLSALPTRGDLALEIGDRCSSSGPGSAAKVLSRALPWLLRPLSRYGCTLVLVTQTREKPNVLYGNPNFALGGRALRHYASVRLEVGVTKEVRQANLVVGQKVQIKVTKNKCGPQFRTVHVKTVF